MYRGNDSNNLELVVYWMGSVQCEHDVKVNTTTINTHNQQVQIPEVINSDMCGIEEISVQLCQDKNNLDRP